MNLHLLSLPPNNSSADGYDSDGDGEDDADEYISDDDVMMMMMMKIKTIKTKLLHLWWKYLGISF